MTDHPDVIRVWLEGLVQRGIAPEARNGRIRFSKPAYRALTPQDVLMLHTHRQAIRDALVSGVLDHIAPSIPVIDKRRVRLEPEPVKPPRPICAFCGRACVGIDHHAYSTLHADDPTEIQKRHDQHAREFWMTLARVDPRLAYRLALRELIPN